jgi:hypothetical protein
MSAISSRDEAADREAEQVDPLKVHRLDEGDRIVGHCFDRAGRRAGRCRHPGVIERDDPSSRGERVDKRRVPVVEAAAEVLQQDERHVALAEIAVCVVDSVSRRAPLSGSLDVCHQRTVAAPTDSAAFSMS